MQGVADVRGADHVELTGHGHPAAAGPGRLYRHLDRVVHGSPGQHRRGVLPGKPRAGTRTGRDRHPRTAGSPRPDAGSLACHSQWVTIGREDTGRVRLRGGKSGSTECPRRQDPAHARSHTGRVLRASLACEAVPDRPPGSARAQGCTTRPAVSWAEQKTEARSRCQQYEGPELGDQGVCLPRGKLTRPRCQSAESGAADCTGPTWGPSQCTRRTTNTDDDPKDTASLSRPYSYSPLTVWRPSPAPADLPARAGLRTPAARGGDTGRRRTGTAARTTQSASHNRVDAWGKDSGCR